MIGNLSSLSPLLLSTDKMVQKSEYSQDRLPANYRRPAYDYEDRCNQFRLQSKREFEIQYFPYYNARLKGSIESLKVNALVKWGADVKLCSLSQLGEHEPNSRVAVMGVLFKHMDKQPSILKEVSDDHQVKFLCSVIEQDDSSSTINSS